MCRIQSTSVTTRITSYNVCYTKLLRELGKYSPSLEVAFKISRVFGKPLEAVFSWPQPAEDAARDAADETRAAMEDKNGA